MSEIPTIGRPPVYVMPDGRQIILAALKAFLESRAKRRIMVVHRRGRKTSTALEEVFRYLMANPGIVGKTLAPVRKQAKEIIWDDPDMLFHPNVCPPQIIRYRNNSDLRIELINGSIWTLDGADDPNAKRGGNTKVLHLTEAGDHQEAIWTQVYEPILKANGGIAIFEGNPRGKNWYWRLFDAALTREGWARFVATAKDTPIFSPAELRDLEANLPAAVFGAEYMCEWVDSIGTVFRNIRELAVGKPQGPQTGRKYRAGTDLGRLQDFTVNSIVDRHSWNQVKLSRFNMVDWSLIKDRLKADYLEYSKIENGNELEVYLECNGIGDPIYDDLVQWMSQKEVYEKHDITIIPFTTTSNSKDLLVRGMSVMLDMRLIQLVDGQEHPWLLHEFEAFAYTKTSTGYVYSAPIGDHDDVVMGTMLSYWNLGAKLPLPEKKGIVKSQWGLTEKHDKRIQSGRSGPPNQHSLL